MAINVSKAVGQDYRAVAIPDPRWIAANVYRSDSSFTEANPRPGSSVASQNTGLVLETSGNMADITGIIPSLTLTTSKGGMPGTSDGRFTFTPNYSLPAGHETSVGWDAPNAISRSELVHDAVNPGTVGGCITLQDNTVLWAIIDNEIPRVVRKVFDSAGYAATGAVKWAWGAPAAVTSLALSKLLPIAGTPCFIQLPEGRVHLYIVFEDIIVSGLEFGQVRMWYSDDSGATWTASDKVCLDVPIDTSSTVGGTNPGFDISRMRCAYSEGEVLLLITGGLHLVTGVTYANVVWQYASSDLGHSFAQIDLGGTGGCYSAVTLGAADLPAFIDVVAAKGGGFVASYNQAFDAFSGDQGAPSAMLLGSAFVPWTSGTRVPVMPFIDRGVFVNRLLTGVGTSIAVDDTGVISLSFASDTNPALGISTSAISLDNGATWNWNKGYMATPTVDDWGWWRSGDTNFYPTNYVTTYHCGRVLVLTQFTVRAQQAPLLVTDMYWELDLGGHTTATRPFKQSDESDTEQLQWTYSWIPAQRMSDTTGWTLTGTGTEVLGSGISTTTTGVGQSLRINNPGAVLSVVNGFVSMGQVEFKVTVGGYAYLEVVVGDGANYAQFQIRQTPTSTIIFDVATASSLYTAASLVPGGFHQFLWSYNWATSRLSLWVRASLDDVQIRPWKQILDYVVVGLLAGADVARIRVEQIASTTAMWRAVNMGEGRYGRPMFRGGAALAAGYLDTIYGRAYSAYPLNVYSGDGVRIRGVDGPSWDGDVFTITQRHEYGVENIFPNISPSPRRTWRSTNLTQQDIVVQLDNTADPGAMLGRVLCIGAFNANFQQLQVSYRDTVGAGAYTVLGTLMFNAGQTSLRWIRDGHTVRPNTAGGATSASDYFTYNILEDSHIRIADGAGAVVRAITTNTEGSWTDTTKVRPRIYCAAIAATDGTSGASGEIWSKDGILLIHDTPDICELKFTIPAGITAEGYFELGSLFIGHVAYFGRQYARGRALQLTPNAEMSTGRSGTRRSQVFGPARRSVEFSWANENETDASQLATVDPDYILAATGSTDPVASPADTPYKMAGLVEALRGVATPCIYLPKVPMVSAENVDTTQVNRNLFMLGRIVSAPRIETILGSEWATAGELARVATVAFEEEV